MGCRRRRRPPPWAWRPRPLTAGGIGDLLPASRQSAIPKIALCMTYLLLGVCTVYFSNNPQLIGRSARLKPCNAQPRISIPAFFPFVAMSPGAAVLRVVLILHLGLTTAVALGMIEESRVQARENASRPFRVNADGIDHAPLRQGAFRR